MNLFFLHEWRRVHGFNRCSSTTFDSDIEKSCGKKLCTNVFIPSIRNEEQETKWNSIWQCENKFIVWFLWKSRRGWLILLHISISVARSLSLFHCFYSRFYTLFSDCGVVKQKANTFSLVEQPKLSAAIDFFRFAHECACKFSYEQHETSRKNVMITANITYLTFHSKVVFFLRS